MEKTRRQFGALLAAAGFILATCIDPVLAETVEIPSPNGAMTTEIILPPGNGPFPVVIYSHGRSAKPRERAALVQPIRDKVASYWTQKGFAVVAPIRPGYGLSGGPDVENSGGQFCTQTPDYAKTANGVATAIAATVAWVRQQSWAQSDRILLEGLSVGGLGTVAAASRNPPGVVGYINFSGGMGGFPEAWPGRSCRPELLTDLYRTFGASTHLPGIWFYAENDEYWGADAPKAWGAAFNKAGGPAKLVFTGPTPNGHGHSLLNTAPQLWGHELDAFIKARGF